MLFLAEVTPKSPLQIGNGCDFRGVAPFGAKTSIGQDARAAGGADKGLKSGADAGMLWT